MFQAFLRFAVATAVLLLWCRWRGIAVWQSDRVRWPGLLATMQRDKKARAGMLRFIVLDDIAKPRVLAGADESVLQFAYQEIAN